MSIKYKFVNFECDSQNAFHQNHVLDSRCKHVNIRNQKDNVG